LLFVNGNGKPEKFSNSLEKFIELINTQIKLFKTKDGIIQGAIT